MKTEKLFEKDAYLKKIVAKVVHIRENIVFFDKTIFYAQSGGQPGDIGEITTSSGKKIRILNTTNDAQRNVCHHLETPISHNEDMLQLQIDWQRRYQLMKMHSCMHIICSLIDADITGCAVGADKSRMDFNLKKNILDKKQLSDNLNILIANGAKIDYEWWQKEKLQKNPQLVRTAKVLPPSIEDKYRLVNITGIDLQPCGGTHVKNIQEIGKVAITKIKNKGGNNRRIYIEFA